jgi:UV DNA damage endonuclease
MIKRTFLKKGIQYASELSLLNVSDLLPIFQWNIKHNIKVFRMSSCLFPWASEYALKDLPDYDKIQEKLSKAGKYALENGLRLSFHPGPFNILSSPTEKVILNTINDLSTHGEIMDLMHQPRDHRAKINVHAGGAYKNHEKALERMCVNFKRLPENVQCRLTLENDDRANLFSVRHIYENVSKKIGVPIVFDYHHHKFCTGDLTEKEALEMAASTWGDIVPTCHYSESAAWKESKEAKPGRLVKPNAHSDYVYDKINNYGMRLDIVIEAKAKELAIAKYRKDHCAA